MAPLIALVAVTIVARLLGFFGLDYSAYTATWPSSVAVGLAAMFLLTASAHVLPRRRAGLVAIVPPRVPAPSAMVAVTGGLEITGAVGLLVPPVLVPGIRAAAAIGLGLLLLAMFPANVYAAGRRRHPDAPATPLVRRTVMQLVYLAAAVVVAVDVV